MADHASKVAVSISTATAIALALDWLSRRKAEAAPPGEITIPPELMELLVAIAQSTDRVDENILKIISAIASLSISVQGWVPNADGTRSFAIACVAAATPYQAYDMEIPDGMALAIKSFPLNAVGSLIFVSRTSAESTNPNSAWPLIPNEAITYLVKNAKAFYVSTNVAGSIAIFTAEQRG